MRRTYMIGMVALGLMVTAARTSPAYCHFLTSARTFRSYFHDLKEADATLNPVQRFVFSLVLINEKPRPQEVRHS